jgi:demethylmenaquinone methyltransferase/2-methoxy-6-polyprenyl-1,4-benzoquinol methylase
MKYSKDPKFISKMFDEISPTYDRLNHIFSGMQDIKWRRQAVRYLAKEQAVFENILDLASGSGDLAKELMSLNPERLFSVDLSNEMLKINKQKVTSEKNIIIQAEAELLPFPACYFDVVGIGFGVRNFENLGNCVKEIARVLKPGGRFLTIEMFKNSKNGMTQKSFKLYFQKILPKLGNFLANSDYAYDYLFESVDNFLTAEQYSELLSSTGLKIEYYKNNFIGIVHTVIAKKK